MITDELRKHLLGKTDAIGRMIAEEMPPPEGCDDWEYRDIPWADPDTWNAIFRTIGEGNAKPIAFSDRRVPTFARRGQFWVSPAGCANLKEWAERKPS